MYHGFAVSIVLLLSSLNWTASYTRSSSSRTSTSRSFRRVRLVHVNELASSEDIATISSTETKKSGYVHTEESKAKISAAKKGKMPWNVGMSHNEETRRLIAERTKEAMQRKKLERAAALGLTLEQYDQRKKTVKREKQQAQNKGGLTEDGRKRISESMKRRWEDEEYRAKTKLQACRNHSNETKARISEAIKLKWQDEEYRAKIERFSPSEEVRARISSTLKARWEDPNFRERMSQSMSERPYEWREKVSVKIKTLWENETYRSKVLEGARASNKTYLPMARASRVAKDVISAEEKAMRRLEVQRLKREKEAVRKDAIRQAKKAQKEMDKKQSLKEMLGRELWFEEKLKRRKEGDTALIDDDELELEITQSWKDEDEDEDEGDEDETNEANEDIVVEDWELDGSMDDVIEVYDEDGELVCTYNAQEYAKLQSAKKL